MIRERLLTTVLAVLIVLALAACSSPEKPEEKPAPAPAVETSAPVPTPAAEPIPAEPVAQPEASAVQPEAKPETPAEVKTEATPAVPAAVATEKPAAPTAKPAKPKKPAAKASAPSKVLVLSAPAGVTAKQPPVAFPHATHAKIDCVECHHTWKGSGKIDSCTTAGCHDLFKAETPEEKKSIKKFDKAFHDQCLACHRKEKAGGNTKVPTACAECHKK